jgi:hypothetical protein
MYGDFDMMFGEAEPEDTGRVYVAFEDEASDERTYTDMKTLEGKHQMTYQEMKEHVLGSVSLVFHILMNVKCGSGFQLPRRYMYSGKDTYT